MKDKALEVKPGTIYLDIATGELYYDDPSQTNIDKHHKVIDAATLIYTISESISFPSKGNEDTNVPGGNGFIPGSGSGGNDSGDTPGGDITSGVTAKLGMAILGAMVLGAE